ncbi:MAG: sulfur carrier protein ThiS [Candidatus Omnitrophica bacterium]|nr:sulfur carrier protein ThiS [Candidatus Omnitrophota bacterium]MDD5487815.1 sulfur carrier protein ThiS [Candidatus Omnitrophota bacterium]
MVVNINGEQEVMPDGTDLYGIITGKGLEPDKVLVEHNLEIVPREKWRFTKVNEGDNVEIFAFVGGG